MDQFRLWTPEKETITLALIKIQVAIGKPHQTHDKVKETWTVFLHIVTYTTNLDD